MQTLVALIMAGGSGTRFWPLSRPERPKQFLRLVGDRTMLQLTIDRMDGLIPPERILVITNESFVDLVKEQSPEIPEENIIGEPMPRETAAAITLGCAIIEERWPGAVAVVMPSDHTIEPKEDFHRTIISAATAAAQDATLYTFGIKPTFPAEGFGYLESGRELKVLNGVRHFELRSFKEKPDRATAENYLGSGRYFWNSGIFVWKAATILYEIRRNLPEHYFYLVPLAENRQHPAWKWRLRQAFQAVPKISIDYGVMEKAERIAMVEANYKWNDVGGWLALERLLPADHTGNYSLGNLHSLESSDNIIIAEDPNHLVACVGVTGLVVVHTEDATLICKKEDSEKVKQLVQQLSAKK
ncbi:MAG: mannose-1-phosphate guanylyltransferase [Armatimonadetes bacterium]|nr:mannose-1-phosphate guanylyltransferase [Armatimonadota bacterium]